MKCVVVTGASRGIGQYLAERLANDYDVVGVARTIPEEFKGRFIQADVGDRSQLNVAIKSVDLKQLYGLINCAGVASMNLFLTTPQETIETVLKVNTLGTINTCSVFLPAMIRNHEGRIVNLSSIAVKLGLEGEAVYVASKAAIEAFGRVLAKEVGTYGITVNTVSPNPIDTALLAGVQQKTIERLIRDRQAVKRKGQFEDVLNAVRFYLDERSNLISGQNLVLGGY